MRSTAVGAARRLARARPPGTGRGRRARARPRMGIERFRRCRRTPCSRRATTGVAARPRRWRAPTACRRCRAWRRRSASPGRRTRPTSSAGGRRRRSAGSIRCERCAAREHVANLKKPATTLNVALGSACAHLRTFTTCSGGWWNLEKPKR